MPCCSGLEPALVEVSVGHQVACYLYQSLYRLRLTRLAVNYAIDRKTINGVERMGLGRMSGAIIPRGLEFALALEP
jgi:hypothetical protein